MIKSQLRSDKLAMGLSMACVIHCFFAPSIIILAFTFLAFNIGGHLVLIFCSLIIFLLFLEVNLATLDFSKKINISILPLFGAIAPFFTNEGTLFLVFSFLVKIYC